MTHEFKDIVYKVKDHIATITINRPRKMNAVTADSLREIEIALDEAGKDSGVGVVVLTGAGDKAFCAGADVDDRGRAEQCGSPCAASLGLYRITTGGPKPVIAA